MGVGGEDGEVGVFVRVLGTSLRAGEALIDVLSSSIDVLFFFFFL